MHYSCFELYLAATARRHHQQIARNHPERVDFKEFVCPLCKALGNTFLPIIWKAKECAQEHELHAAKSFPDWLTEVDKTYTANLAFLESAPAAMHRQQQVQDVYSNRSFQYVASMFTPSIVNNMNELSLENSNSPTGTSSVQQRYPLRQSATLSRLFGLSYGGAQNPAVPGSDQASPISEQNRLNDLLNAYRRIEDSIRTNQLCEPEKWDGSTNPVVAMSRALGLSISSFEISHRGVGNDPFATSLLSEMPEQALTHLRILSETIESYLALNILKSGSNVVARETIKKRDVITAQLFGSESNDAMERLQAHVRVLFQDDTFLFFADWLSFMAPNVAEASSIMQLCYWAEIVKTMFIYLPIVKSQGLGSEGAPGPNPESLRAAAAMMNLEYTNGSFSGAQIDAAQASWLRLLVEKYALAFLRKSAVLMLVRYGLDFECPYNIDPETSELQRLTALLHLPSVEEMCTTFISHSAAGENLRKITSRWLYQAHTITQMHAVLQIPSSLKVSPITIPHPAIFELVGLPKNYDTLTEEAIRRRCPTTGKEISDPALCLLCGEIFCSQAVCCMKDKSKGGCYQHMEKHGLKVGLFINVRKCMVLFLHGPGSGSFAQAPYLDRHGEPDPTLRKHHQLYLNQKRYDRLLRDVWLGHMIPSVISRKLEGDINPGGWETL